MALKKVVVYFEDQRDALRFALAAGSVLAEEAHSTPRETPLTQTLRRAARIRSGGTITLEEEPSPPHRN